MSENGLLCQAVEQLLDMNISLQTIAEEVVKSTNYRMEQ